MCASLPATNNIEIAPAPAGARLCADFQVWINEEPVPVYPSAAAPFATFSFSSTVTLKVTREGMRWKAPRPNHFGVPWKQEGDTLLVTLAEPANLVLEGENGEEIFVFANPLETDRPGPSDPEVLYFGPGIHHPGVIEVNTGQTVYLAAGSVVHGQIKDAAGASWAQQGTNTDAAILPHPRPFVTDIQIRGRGILCGSTVKRGSGTDSDPYGMMIDLYGVTRARIEGIIIDQPPYWAVVPRMCDDLTIENLKVIGTQINNDGIQLRNCSNVLIKDCFLRTNDDAIAIKGFNSCNRKSNRNILVEGAVIYNKEGGQALEIGHSTKCAYISEITFRDIDILDSHFEALSINSVDAAHIRNIRYENIRIEKADRFIAFVVTTSKYSDDPSGNWIHGIVVKDVTSPVNTVEIQADYVLFENVTAAGKRVTGPGLLCGKIGSNTHFSWPGGPPPPPDPEPVPAPSIEGNLLLHQQAWRAENGREAENTPWKLNGDDLSAASAFRVPAPYPRWIEVDLETNFPLAYFELKPHGNSTCSYRIHVRPDNGEWLTVVDRSRNTEAGGFFSDTIKPVSARFIRLEVTGTPHHNSSPITLDAFRAYSALPGHPG